MNRRIEDELTEAANAWDRAMVTNDADAIGVFMTDDWLIIGPDGTVSDKETFLGPIRSGMLTHSIMESHDLNVRVYGDTGIVVARGVSGGKWEGTDFYLLERATSVFVKQQGRWLCVLTHLSGIGS